MSSPRETCDPCETCDRCVQCQGCTCSPYQDLEEAIIYVNTTNTPMLSDSSDEGTDNTVIPTIHIDEETSTAGPPEDTTFDEKSGSDEKLWNEKQASPATEPVDSDEHENEGVWPPAFTDMTYDDLPLPDFEGYDPSELDGFEDEGQDPNNIPKITPPTLRRGVTCWMTFKYLLWRVVAFLAPVEDV